MDESLTMGGRERAGDLSSQADDLSHRERALFQSGGERLSIEVLHDEKRDATILGDVMKHADARVLERSDGLGLAQEPFAKLAVTRDPWRQNLQRDSAVQAQVPGQVDLTHSPGPEGRLNFVPAQATAGGQTHVTNTD